MPLKLLPFIFLGFLALGRSKPMNGDKTAFDSVYNWNFVEYEFDSVQRKEQMLNTSYYNKVNMAIFDFDLAKDGRVFITVNSQKGKPASLNTVVSKKGKGGPLLRPFPDWNWHARDDCIGLYKVTRIQIDDCNRLWVLDSGFSYDSKMKCPTQLLQFDLASNKLTSRIKIPKEYTRDRDGNGYLADLIVQTDGWWCQNTMVYMSYYKGTGLVVWNGNNMWRLNGPDKPNLVGRIKVGKRELSVHTGIFGFSMSPKTAKGPQILALRSLGSRNMMTATLKDILASEPKDPALKKNFLNIFDVFKAAENTTKSPKMNDKSTIKYQVHENVLPSPSAAHIFNEKGVLFMGLIDDNAIACWNKAKNLTADNVDVIDKDKVILQLVAGAKIFQNDKTGNGEELWATISNYGGYEYRSMDFSQVNFRLVKVTTRRILVNSKCM